jgi:hypothetical protein
LPCASRGDFLARLHLEQIRDRAALGGAAHVRNLVHALDVDAARVGEKHQVIVGRGCEEMLDEIVVLGLVALARGHADDAAPAAPLRAVAADVGALDERGVGERDDHAFVGDEVLDRHLALVGDDLRAPLVAVLLLDRLELLLDDGEHADFLGQDVHEIGDLLEQVLVLVDDLAPFQPGELVEA